MRTLRLLLGFALACTICAGFSGCVGPISAADSGVTTLANFQIGNMVPIRTFTTQDTIVFYVAVTWENISMDAGLRDVEWRWYKDGKMVAHFENERGYFKGAPNLRHLIRPAASLGTGHFRAECLIDGHPIASQEFDIQ
jgi:hypothetical protein